MLINKQITKSVVCINANKSPVGTGVILRFNDHLFLCTCKHVVQSAATAPPAVYEVVINNQSTKESFGLTLGNFAFHKSADIGLTLLNVPLLLEKKSDVSCIAEDMLLYYGMENFNLLGLGEIVFALGFPLGLTGSNRNYPILRGGFIARLDSECIEQEKHFLIDSNIFPGNSGGPVFLKPEVFSVPGTAPVNQGYLLGIVSAYIPYVDRLISAQTNKIVSTSREHSGLSKVVPIHYAKEIYDEHFAKKLPK